MNHKRVLVTGIAVFVAYMVMGVFVHGLWLGPTYASLAGDVWRPQAELSRRCSCPGFCSESRTFRSP